MLIAQLKGKLTREEEDLEDLLTSNIFGSLKYLAAEVGIMPLLSAVEKIDKTRPFEKLAKILEVKYEFWPFLKEKGCYPCEPDVLLRIFFKNGEKTVVLIEAKFKSGKSSFADQSEMPYDQLAREWDNLVVLANREKARPLLLYITPHIGLPYEDVDSAKHEYAKKRGPEKEIDIGWISWRKLPAIYADSQNELIKDAVEILRRMGLTYFEGFSVTDPKDIRWSFSYKRKSKFITISWDFRVAEISWEYDRLLESSRNLKRFSYYEIQWRFNK